jgi:hypothetical protein
MVSSMPCHCASGWICEAHPDHPWPHDDCAGPGEQCCNPDCAWWAGSEPAALNTEGWDVVYASTRVTFRPDVENGHGKLSPWPRHPPPSKRSKIPGERQDVSRMEFDNIEGVVRGNAERQMRLEQRLDTISRQIAELTRGTRRPFQLLAGGFRRVRSCAGRADHVVCSADPQVLR